MSERWQKCTNQRQASIWYLHMMMLFPGWDQTGCELPAETFSSNQCVNYYSFLFWICQGSLSSLYKHCAAIIHTVCIHTFDLTLHSSTSFDLFLQWNVAMCRNITQHLGFCTVQPAAATDCVRKSGGRAQLTAHLSEASSHGLLRADRAHNSPLVSPV